MFPHKSDGSGYSYFEFAHDQPAVENYDFAHSKIFETFPFMSCPNLVKKISSKFSNLSESSASTPDGLSNVKQEGGSELQSGLINLQIEILRLYDKAGALHLDCRFDQARDIYSQLLVNQELPAISDSAKFFFGVTYFNESKYEAAV